MSESPVLKALFDTLPIIFKQSENKKEKENDDDKG